MIILKGEDGYRNVLNVFDIKKNVSIIMQLLTATDTYVINI